MPNLFINPLNTAIMEVTVMPNAASVQKQQGLNQVVINKVQKMIEGKQQSVMGTITRLLEEGKIAQDFIAPIGVNRVMRTAIRLSHSRQRNRYR